jgi:hypothetical protein
MKIFQVKAWSARIDWASTAHECDLGFFMSRESAEKMIRKIKRQKGWRMDWSAFQIWEVEVKP